MPATVFAHTRRSPICTSSLGFLCAALHARSKSANLPSYVLAAREVPAAEVIAAGISFCVLPCFEFEAGSATRALRPTKLCVGALAFDFAYKRFALAILREFAQRRCVLVAV
jgi:hypothetical protein